jgi:hypothetical protein
MVLSLREPPNTSTVLTSAFAVASHSQFAVNAQQFRATPFRHDGRTEPAHCRSHRMMIGYPFDPKEAPKPKLLNQPAKLAA